ncbi:MAG: ABC transporter permease [Spirochaetales bacterium]|nr:MAG: ABC transporter permease [Spirochaetales bacterium]
MIAIMQRELRTYFQTPIGYIFMGLFLLVSGFFFASGNLLAGSSYYTSFLGSILFLYLFSVPLLTMRLMSEERRQRTDQLLLTSPITVLDIVGGKFLAAFIVFLGTLFVTALYAVVVGIFGDLAVWETVGGYIGFVLLGSSFISLGVLISTVSENQVSSAFFTFFVLLLIWFLDMIKSVAPVDLVSGTIFAAALGIGIVLFFFFNTRSWIAAGAALVVVGVAIGVTFIVDQSIFLGFIPKVLNWFSLLQRFDSFTLGLVKLQDVVYYLSFTSVFLFITMRLVEKRRWA